jgi:Rps23 Pro-64 3,4-dihydroxylase Tpa1-like proline 4-hydroxylase
MIKEKLAVGIYSYYDVFPESFQYVEKIENLVNENKLAWVPSFNKKTTTEEQIKKSFRNVDTIALPLKSQVLAEKTDFNSEPNTTLFEFSENLISNFKPFLEDYLNNFGITVSEQEVFGLLKYGNGQKFDKHIDDGMRFIRKVSSVYYLNNDYSGGDIYFDQFDLKITPQKNQLIVFPSNYIYSHSISEVSSGIRYAIAGFYK